MRMKALLAVCLLALAVIVGVTGTGHHSARAASNGALVTYLPYDQALAAHYSSAERAKSMMNRNPEHLPTCSESSFKREGGYSSAAAASAAVAASQDKPACMADPHDALYGPALSACTAVGTGEVSPAAMGCSSTQAAGRK